MSSGRLTLRDVGESALLREVLSRLSPAEGVLVGPGDDTALLATSGQLLATTDTMVRGRDWRDDWSSPADVGAKLVTQNLADLAAMGGVGTALLVTLVAPGSLPVAWVTGFVEGLAGAAARAGVPVVGGDLSSSQGEVMVSLTALGELSGPGPVLRSGARVGDVLAVSDQLGRSAAGLELLRMGEEGSWPPAEAGELAASLVGYHCRPDPDLAAGPLAAAAGATSMIDVSDGLGRDAARVAEASEVTMELAEDQLLGLAAQLEPAVGPGVALRCILAGGEEHVLLATFAGVDVPHGWTVIGAVRSADRIPRVLFRGTPVESGWDHFRE